MSAPPAVPPVADLQAVVFDLDGVLVDSFPVMREAFGIAYREVVGTGDPPFAEYARYLGRYFPDIMRLMGLPAEMEGPFVRESYRLAGRVRVYDGIVPMLALLGERGIRVAVATGKSGPRARSLLGVLGLLDAFDIVVGSDEIVRPKPAPDIVRHALAHLDVPPGRAVMVGDAPTDLQSAHAAGVCAAAALWGGETAEEELLAAGPDLVLRSPAEVATLLAGPARR